MGRFGLLRLIADQLDFVICYLMMEAHKRLGFQLDGQSKRLTNAGFQNHGGIGLVGVDAGEVPQPCPMLFLLPLAEVYLPLAVIYDNRTANVRLYTITALLTCGYML